MIRTETSRGVAVNADGSIAMRGRRRPLPVVPSNINTKFREAFESFMPGVKWNQTLADADIIQVDGNTGGASYLVISKNPLVQNTVSSIETVSTFDFPFDISLGLHRSQAVLGTEFAVEMVDTDTPTTPPTTGAITTAIEASVVLPKQVTLNSVKTKTDYIPTNPATTTDVTTARDDVIDAAHTDAVKMNTGIQKASILIPYNGSL